MSLQNRKQKNLSTLKIKEIGKNLLKLEKNFSKLGKYYDHDNIEYKGIRDAKFFLIYQSMKVIINQ